MLALSAGILGFSLGLAFMYHLFYKSMAKIVKDYDNAIKAYNVFSSEVMATAKSIKSEEEYAEGMIKPKSDLPEA